MKNNKLFGSEYQDEKMICCKTSLEGKRERESKREREKRKERNKRKKQKEDIGVKIEKIEI